MGTVEIGYVYVYKDLMDANSPLTQIGAIAIERGECSASIKLLSLQDEGSDGEIGKWFTEMALNSLASRISEVVGNNPIDLLPTLASANLWSLKVVPLKKLTSATPERDCANCEVQRDGSRWTVRNEWLVSIRPFYPNLSDRALSPLIAA